MNSTQKVAASVAALTLALPLVSLAQITATPPHIGAVNLVSLGNVIVTQVWVFFTIVAIIMFVVAGIQFLTSGGDPERVQKARSSFLWGVAGVAVGIIAYAIVTIVSGALGAA